MSHDLTALLLDLIRIDSQNPQLVPGAPGEREIAEYCVSWLRRHGVEAWVDELEPGRCNAVAQVRGADRPTLALCAHLDTVSIDGMTEPGLEPRMEDGRMYGRGAYDMKSGAAAIMVALAELARNPPPIAVMAALVCDEEYASIGAADFVRRYPCDACIVTEPSEGRLILAHKGFVWAEVETRGVAAHGSRWEEGVSAIAAMGRIIGALDEFDRTVLRHRTHPLLGPASMHCAMIEGGDGWSTYAPRCTLRVERRTLPGESPATVLDELRALVERAGERAGVREVLSRSPLECPPDSPIARAVRRAATAAGGGAPEEAGVAYWMDAAIFADAGAQTVDYGPAGAGAHGAVEWVDTDSVETCARVLVAAARGYPG
ncbi:MAG TPA: M20/M25/M40 family metallo-hydrolase [Longimicrobiales bacterium]